MTQLQKATRYYAIAKQLWTLANLGRVDRRVAISHLNKTRPALVKQIRLAEAYLGREHRV